MRSQAQSRAARRSDELPRDAVERGAPRAPHLRTTSCIARVRSAGDRPGRASFAFEAARKERVKIPDGPTSPRYIQLTNGERHTRPHVRHGRPRPHLVELEGLRCLVVLQGPIY
jgi:hypothetical protein